MERSSKQHDVLDHVRQALKIADDLATAVLRGSPGQQKLALDYARALDDARRGGFDLTKRV